MKTVLFLILITAAGSYGWGMRGTTIGGEKGAMLPGAIIGACIATFFNMNIALFSALGAIGMYFGGCMTYGETLGLSMHEKRSPTFKQGILGVAVKGLLWFAMFGEVIGTGIYAYNDYYSLFQLIMIFVLVPLCSIVGLFLFNKPLNAKKGVFPKFYFSLTRQESWGAMFGAWICLFAISIVSKNTFAWVFSLGCAITGCAGFSIGQLLQVFSRQYAKDCRYPLSLLASSKYVSAWKIMECVFGAIGGLGAGISFIVARKFMIQFDSVGSNQVFDNATINVLYFVWLAIIALDTMHFIVKLQGKKKKVFENIFEGIEPILYAALPFILICFGSEKTAVSVGGIILYLVLIQEIVFESDLKNKTGTIYKGFLLLSLIPIVYFNIRDGYNDIVFVSVVYEIFTLIMFYFKNGYKEPNLKMKDNILSMLKSSLSTVHGYFIICLITFIALYSVIR